MENNSNNQSVNGDGIDRHWNRFVSFLFRRKKCLLRFGCCATATESTKLDMSGLVEAFCCQTFSVPIHVARLKRNFKSTVWDRFNITFVKDKTLQSIFFALKHDSMALLALQTCVWLHLSKACKVTQLLLHK